MLDEDVSVLTDAEAGAFAQGILKVLESPELGGKLAANAFQLSEKDYSYKKYTDKTELVYDQISQVIDNV